MAIGEGYSPSLESIRYRPSQRDIENRVAEQWAHSKRNTENEADFEQNIRMVINDLKEMARVISASDVKSKKVQDPDYNTDYDRSRAAFGLGNYQGFKQKDFLTLASALNKKLKEKSNPFFGSRSDESKKS